MINHLAANGAESEGIEEATVTDTAGVGDAFARPRLRAAALVQKHYLRTVDNVGLHPCDIQILLNLTYSDYIVIR